MEKTTPIASDSGRFPPDLADRYCVGDTFARRLLEAGSEFVALSQGQALFRQGDPGDSMYLLLQGCLAVRLETEEGTETQLAELGPGAPVGEMALLTGQPRTASVHALTDAELVRCSRASYKRLAVEYPGELAGFTRTVTRRLQEVQLASVLASLFRVQDAQTLGWLQQELEWIQLSHGDVLFREGDPGDAMYILVSGRLRITTSKPEDGQQMVGEVSPGEIVGELGLLSGEPRAATAVAIRETHAVRMTLDVFEQLAERQPNVMMRLTRLIIKRQQRSLRVLEQTPIRALAVALVPISAGVSPARFAEELACCLSAFGSVLLLDSARLDDTLGKPGTAQAETDHPTGLVVSAWLSEQETRYRYLLYVADRDWSPWTQRCVCQADRLLLLGDAQASSELGPMEQAIGQQNLPVRQELILLHPDTAQRPSGTASWLSKRHLRAHHHIRLGDQVHTKRLARRLAGRSLGLVLSGGGARGFAHYGVLRAMEEQGIEVDLVGGTSMGAVVGAIFSMGCSYSEAHKIIEKYFAKRQTLFDYTLPLVSLMATEKVTNAMIEVFGETRIEDLWTSFFCVSSNLTRAEPVVHQTGPVWKAVRASSAIPGVYVPILDEGDVLVDGAIMNNLPVDIMHDLCEAGTIIGVNVSPPRERAKVYSFGAGISGWQVLRSRINPLKKQMQVPSLVGSISRAMEINSVHHLKSHQGLVDLLIQPDVTQFGIMDFEAYEPILDIGYQAGKDQLASWLREHTSALQSPEHNTSSLLSLGQTLRDLESVIDSLSQDKIP